MKFLKKKFNEMIRSSLITSIILLLVGLLLIVKPEEVLSLISIIIGIGILIIGIFGLLNYIRDLQEDHSMSLDIIYGIICIIVGSVLIINTKIVGSILPIVLGIWMVINSVIKAQYTLLLKENGNSKWKITLIFSIFTLICGILFIFNPFKGAAFITQIIGIIVVVYAIMDIANVILLKKNIHDFEQNVKKEVKKVKKSIDQAVTEATYEEVAKSEEKGKKKTKKSTSKKTKKD